MMFTRSPLVFFSVFLLITVFGSGPAHAKRDVAIQELKGRVGSRGAVVYEIPKLKPGEMLYVYMEGTSGNLDPLVALLKPGIDIRNVQEDILARLNSVKATGEDTLLAARDTLREVSLVWNDDYGGAYTAAFEYEVRTGGAYKLLAAGTLLHENFGSYRLLVGVNAPEVLNGTAKPSGPPFVFVDKEAASPAKAVSEIEGTLSRRRNFTFYNLTAIHAGETLYVYFEVTSGDLRPVITLYDFGDKPLWTANLTRRKARVTMQRTFVHDARNFRIKISGRLPDGSVTEGDYRLLLGLDAPEVLEGRAVSAARHVLREPTPVKIGLKMQQITSVDQRAENFGVVATMMMEWQSPELAFNPETIQERAKIYTGDTFAREMSGRGILWPEFTIFNQQGNRWAQNRIVAVFYDGNAVYLERFSTSLQAPDFDFRRFPFDTQQFFIRIDSLLPEWLYVFVPLEEYSEVGKELGEEEWVVTKFDTDIDHADIARRPVSRFNFRFEAQRHLNYYFFRIFLPIVIIITVSWIIFFLKDYGKRVDVAGGNLLLFIAFNFAISNDLPRLGYLTFLDATLISAFLVTALVLILAVVQRRMVTDGREAIVKRIDKYVIWFYPIAYLAAVVTVTLLFD